jgi:hypothetical protein
VKVATVPAGTVRSYGGKAARPDSSAAGTRTIFGWFKEKGHIPAGQSQRRTFDV